MTAPPGPPPEELAGWREEVRQWREARLHRLRSPTGWLSLVDRVVLEEGQTALDIGTVTRRGQEVRLAVAAGVEVTRDGVPVSELALHSAAGPFSGNLASGGRRYELLVRGATLALRVKDPASPALQQFAGLAHYPLDPRWRVTARFERYRPPRTTRHVYELGEGEDRVAPGIARFEAAGRALALEPVLEDDGRRLFFVFGDLTNGQGSYPGGRFLYAEIPGASDTLVLDFNLAFNPPCAFTPFASCPAIPAGNRLAVAVQAGERHPTRDLNRLPD